MGVTLDTSALIDLLRGDPKVLSRLDGLERAGLNPVLSAVSVFEVLSVVELTQSRSERARLEVFLRQIPIEAFGLDSARRAGELRAELMRGGRSPGAPDVMIAGHALAQGHTLVTRDQRLGAAAASFGVSVATY